ncbi:MAG: M20 family metallopeptidase [Gemmatimonadaceae bacterium]
MPPDRESSREHGREIDWEAATRDVVEQLQRLIRFPTINPPGDERAIADYLIGVLRAAGVKTRRIDTDANRSAVVATIRGSGARAPLMLVAHTDVVGVDAERWSIDPFGGELRDGYVYGRGAIDDKGMLAVNLVTMLLLQRQVARGHLVLERDVVFLATPDEESGGAFGMQWLVQHEPDLLNVEYAINEGGRIRVGADGSLTLLLQVAEKTSHIVTLTAHGTSGHAGVPRPDNSVLRLGRALASISEYASDPAHGVSPTIVAGGAQSNVIPDQARATLNVRTTPDQQLSDVVGDLVRLVNDADVVIAVEEKGEGAPASSEGSALYAAIVETARSLIPNVVVTPYLSAGVTDSARLRKLGVQAYGILPFPLTLDDEGRMHGVDERVPVASLGFGVRLVYGSVARTAAAQQLN